MRALAISLILFALAITAVCVNSAFIHRTAQKVKDLALSVINGESEAADDLTDYWEKRKRLVSLTVGLREIDTVSEQILKLCACAQLDKADDLFINYLLLCNAIDDITRYERMTLTGIF